MAIMSAEGMAEKPSMSAVLSKVQASAASLAQSSIAVRSQALVTMASTLRQHQDDILEANTLDLEISREMAVPDKVVDWLKLTPERLHRTVSVLQRLSELGSPLDLSRGWSGLQGRPVGVVALVYEGFPDLGAIAAGLCLRTGNGLVLKGGNESSHTNQAMVTVLQAAIATTSLPVDILQLIPIASGEVSRGLLVQRPEIDLVIPYGRLKLVEQVIEQATVPVLPTRIGNCYLCLTESADFDLLCWMLSDSHCGDPEAINRIEKVMVVGNCSETFLLRLWRYLTDANFELRATADLQALSSSLKPVADPEWSTPYLQRTIAFRRAQTLSEAITWINQYSSRHADSIVTASYKETQQFQTKVQSASVYINTSPRFYHNPPDATAIALGASHCAGHWGGLVGLNALLKSQRVVHSQPDPS